MSEEYDASSAPPDEGEQPEEPRTYPSTIGGAIYLVILACAAGAIAIATLADWRFGVKMLGCCLCAAALTRLALSDANAGMLKVRNKYLDATLLTVVGAALIFLAITVPNQPGA